MDHKKHSQKRSRLNKTFEIIDSSSLDNYFSENNNSKSSKSASDISKLRYFNSSNQSVSRNHQTVNDDSDNEENFNKIPNNEQYNRRDSSSSEETDENNSDNDVHKRKIKQSSKVLSKQEKRRKKTSQRRLYNQREEKRISSSRNDNEEDIDEDRASLKRHRTVQTARKNSKRLRTTKSRNGKESGKKEGRGGTKDNEVPITEILRQAEENPRRQYEEPKPLTQLSTDTIYVQGVNRFSAVKIPAERITRGRRGPDTGETAMYPIKIAILAQKAWKNAGFIYQGLLAGMAFIHFILIQIYFKPLKKPIEDYSIIAEIYTNLFSFFIVMCIISAFDRFDLAHFDIEHFRGLYNNYAKAMTENITTTTISDEELENWKAITLTKDGIVVVAWLLVSFGPPNDMLLTHLKIAAID
ncbi:Protein of unknown function [Cotesia congregata]|uniref:Uncharacterized protein n=1 Tax=Cotesia congregata TaxID=51543 RepID=A0A8J2MPN2_COTCN|nr:Protein of unknown function [Cotesia congregata]